MHPSHRSRRVLCLAVAAAALTASGASGQISRDVLTADSAAPVALVADQVEFDERTGLLTARGAVEIYQGARTLTAAAVIYDSRAGRIRAEGPLVLRDGGGSVLLSDAADMDAELRDGIVAGARALIGGGAGAMAAVEGRRIDGRYTALSRVTYSSCMVCAASPTPLWSIRADRVIHDDVKREVFYENAVFEVAGVPVAWLPYFSHPDPGVERRSGFLAPDFKRSTNYGFATKIPYFIAIDPSRDATITAFPTTDDGPIIEGEYRQRLDEGGFSLSGSVGAVDTDDGQGRRLRGHIFGTGRFDASPFGLGLGSVAGFDLALSSDDGYLRRYDFTSEDRLTTEAFVERYAGRGFYRVAAVNFQSLRDNEPSGGIPLVLPEFGLRHVIDEDLTGGEIGLEASGVSLTRQDGRDVSRLTLGADWDRQVISDTGLVLRGFAAARADLYHIADDPNLDTGLTTRLAPHVGAEARYPLIAREERAAHIVEPIAQLVVAPNGLNNSDIPNEDSLIVEFDETNLFNPNRFPGYDKIESGTRVNLGLRYGRVADDAFILDASFGRVFRLSDESAFSPDSGLADSRSDYVGAFTVGVRPYFSFSNRFRINDDLDIARNEVQAEALIGPLSLEAGYIYLAEDSIAGALENRSEAAIGAELAVDRNWTLGAFMRRDLQNDAFIEASTSIAFRNECTALEFYVERDFTSSADSPASTSVGVRVRLFGAADGAGARSGICASSTPRRD